MSHEPLIQRKPAVEEPDETPVLCALCGEVIDIWDDTYGEPEKGLFHLPICAMEHFQMQLAAATAEIATLRTERDALERSRTVALDSVVTSRAEVAALRQETLNDVAVVERVTNAVDVYIRRGGADYEDLGDVVQRALLAMAPAE